MKKVFILIFAVLIFGNTQNVFSQQENKSENWLKTGSKLTYHLLNISKEYDFVITDLVMDNNIAFTWNMTAPANSSGKVKMFYGAIDTANKIVNYFSNGSSQNMVNKTTVWLSRKVYKKIKSESPTTLIIDDTEEIVNFIRNEKYPITVDGAKLDYDVMVAESATGSKFWILDNPQYPLIIKMELAFTIDLRSVETKK
ncbi:MAG: hypothetical protein PHR81_09430 [Bacteroidales bacterium]|jgi:hypothetical protein|nr:hypothetical protein [Bacteroidales bacterium]MDD4215019.1 hypothetical protein [Bacteroidales bacterium]